MKMTRGAAVICLVMSPCITECERGDGSKKGAPDRWDSSLEVCCCKLLCDVVVSREEIRDRAHVLEV